MSKAKSVQIPPPTKYFDMKEQIANKVMNMLNFKVPVYSKKKTVNDEPESSFSTIEDDDSSSSEEEDEQAKLKHHLMHLFATKFRTVN